MNRRRSSGEGGARREWDGCSEIQIPGSSWAAAGSRTSLSTHPDPTTAVGRVAYLPRGALSPEESSP